MRQLSQQTGKFVGPGPLAGFKDLLLRGEWRWEGREGKGGEGSEINREQGFIYTPPRGVYTPL